MRSISIILETFVILCVTTLASHATEESKIAVESRRTIPSPSRLENDEELDTESARKIIGSRVVTSVSVVMNGKEPQFADAVGNYIPRPLVPPRVASPVSLLDPDRYEFYTFNDDGDLVKRLMTMEEIQSIVANGDSEQPAVALAKNPTEIVDNEAHIRDIVNNVQKVLHSEIVNNNFTQSLLYNKLETPDTSSSWSSILPAIFGNTGDSILANKVVATTGNTADSVLMPQTVNKKPMKHKTPSTSSVVKTTSTPPKTTVNKIIKQKLKPSSATTATPYRPSTLTQNTKHTLTTKTEQIIKNTLPPNSKITYSKQNTTIFSKPTKSATVAITSSSLKPSTIYIQRLPADKITQPQNAHKTTLSAATSVTATKKPVSKRPITSSKLPASSFKTPSVPVTSPISTTTNLPFKAETSTRKNQTHTVLQSQNTHKTTTPKKKSGTTTLKPKTTKITANNVAELKENIVTSTVKYVTTSAQPTRKAVTSPLRTTTHVSPQKPYPNLDALAVIEPEPENVFDSELSLNQIIESLKDLEGTTMPYASNYVGMMDMTTFETETMPAFEKFEMESVTISNDGGDISNPQFYHENGSNDFKQKIPNIVSYIPQTTIDYTAVPSTTPKSSHLNENNQANIKPQINSIHFTAIEHKESDDGMLLDENTTTQIPDITTTTDDTALNKQSTNVMDSLLRESFDSVLLQIQNEDLSTTLNYTDTETTTFIPVAKTNDKKKTVVKPTPFIPMEELDGGAATEPMKYFEAVIKQYEEEKNKTELMNKTIADSTTTKPIVSMLTKTTESLFEIETTTDLTTLATSTENRWLNTEKVTTEMVEDENATPTSSYELRTNINEVTTEDITTTEPIETSTIRLINYSTIKPMDTASSKTEAVTDQLNEESTTAKEFVESTTTVEHLEQTTNIVTDPTEASDENQTKYEMIQLIENIVKNISEEKNSTINLVQRKEDSNEASNKTSTLETNKDEVKFSDLGETVENQNKPNDTVAVKSTITLAPILNDLKMKVVNALKNTNAIKLDQAPKHALGLEESTANADEDILEFAKICNEVAFNFWIALKNEGGISTARSLTLSPFALTSMMAMLFLGARGRTSGEINDMLHMDDIVTFNPHAMIHNITESINDKSNDIVYSNVFVRELISERSKGSILPFFKEKVNQFYSGSIEVVNFSNVNDVIRRRINALMKRNTGGKTNEFLKTSNVWVKPPLAGVSANLFETDCSKASKKDRDGEMFFQVLPAIRQRRLIPIPAAVWKSGFTAGYDIELDATAVAIGHSKNVVSLIFVMPGQQGTTAPGDNLERLESVLMANAISRNAWRRLLATLMERPGLEVQIPRFTHRSFVNTTSALRKLGLDTLFDQNSADLRGITGSNARDMYISDLIQVNTFSTCGEDKLAEEHHIEMYPAPPNKHKRKMEYTVSSSSTSSGTSVNQPVPGVAADYENERAFASDPIYDLKYLNLPLPLRPRQARIPENPRLRFDKPFIYFVRHNPTGMVLYFGRFNPRLLP